MWAVIYWFFFFFSQGESRLLCLAFSSLRQQRDGVGFILEEINAVVLLASLCRDQQSKYMFGINQLSGGERTDGETKRQKQKIHQSFQKVLIQQMWGTNVTPAALKWSISMTLLQLSHFFIPISPFDRKVLQICVFLFFWGEASHENRKQRAVLRHT